jgi:hypothetical protein
VIAGWGISNNGETPDDMLMGTLEYLSIEECENKIQLLEGRRVVVHRRHLCTVANPYILITFVSIRIIKDASI